MFENLIAYHCGPALAGIKPANIVACDKSRIPNACSEIQRLNSRLNTKDIYIDILHECENRVLVMVYRKAVLKKHINDPEMKAFLTSYSYPEDAELHEYIVFLRNRLLKNSFPHEIGVFLGYPLHDIYGFINHRDEGCLLSGEWKVYRDAETAKKLFSRYKACRNAILRRIKNGHSLAQIFCAA